MTFMIAAYMVIWLAVFVFVFTMMRRQQGIESDIATLKSLTTGEASPANHEIGEEQGQAG